MLLGYPGFMERAQVVERLLQQHGTTWADDAGISLRDEPAPLWQLLVLSLLLSARIGSEIAVAAARELFDAGMTTPQHLADSSWQQRVDALGRGRYRRYDERTATQLGRLADVVLQEYAGDVRRLGDTADGVAEVERRLQGFTGIGPAGAAIFCREVQGVWPDLAPYVDHLAATGAQRLGLPAGAAALAALVSSDDLPRLVAACVRAARSTAVVDSVLRAPG